MQPALKQDGFGFARPLPTKLCERHVGGKHDLNKSEGGKKNAIDQFKITLRALTFEEQENWRVQGRGRYIALWHHPIFFYDPPLPEHSLLHKRDAVHSAVRDFIQNVLAVLTDTRQPISFTCIPRTPCKACLHGDLIALARFCDACIMCVVISIHAVTGESFSWAQTVILPLWLVLEATVEFSDLILRDICDKRCPFENPKWHISSRSALTQYSILHCLY